MDITKILKEVLAAIPEFIREFINLLLSPRAYALSAGMFSAARFPSALSFFGVSLVVTLIIKGPLFAAKPDPIPFLLADATWKAVFVLIETGVITIAWRLVGGRGGFGNYFVANCFYFGVLTIIGHVALVFVITLSKRQLASIQLILILVELVFAVLIAIWGFGCWQAYGDYNEAGTIKRIVTLVICAFFSIPSFFVGETFWYAFVGSFFPKPPWA